MGSLAGDGGEPASSSAAYAAALEAEAAGTSHAPARWHDCELKDALLTRAARSFPNGAGRGSQL